MARRTWLCWRGWYVLGLVLAAPALLMLAAGGRPYRSVRGGYGLDFSVRRPDGSRLVRYVHVIYDQYLTPKFQLDFVRYELNPPFVEAQ